MSNIEFTHAELNALYASLIFIADEFRDAEDLLKELRSVQLKVSLALKDEWTRKGVTT